MIVDIEGAQEAFIIAHGALAIAQDLAAVVGCSIEQVLRIRATGACAKQHKRKGFAELFALWHGRPPEEGEWPAPRKRRNGQYPWQAPELALLATLVGQMGVKDIAAVLTKRLRERTGHKAAKRSPTAVQVRINLIGMQSSDVIGGLTTKAASLQIGSLAVVQHAISNQELRPRRVGRLWVIPRDQWAQWKAKREHPPERYVRLSTLRQRLAIKSDKLSEFARMGYIPTAQRYKTYGTGGSTQFGTWYVAGSVAAKLLTDRRAGMPMPWHGQALSDNLRCTFRLWQQRRHPASCKTCHEIWGSPGAPTSFDDYCRRYPPLAHGAKRHLTRVWTPGLRVGEIAAMANCSALRVRRALANGALCASPHGKTLYVTRSNATRWIARRCPTGEAGKSWISLKGASAQYHFSLAELRELIAAKRLMAKNGSTGATVYVLRHQCAQLRGKLGFSEKDAARRAGVTLARLRVLLDGVHWRGSEGIPLATLQAVIKRAKSRAGYTVGQAARMLGKTRAWVQARIADGTVKVLKAQWDGRLYLSAPMLKRLRSVKGAPATRNTCTGEQWLTLGQAAIEAGVSATTVIRWAECGELSRRAAANGWRYHREAVRARARAYWPSARFRRAPQPLWLREALGRTKRRGLANRRQAY